MFVRTEVVNNISSDFYINKNCIFYKVDDIIQIITSSTLEDTKFEIANKFILSVINGYNIIWNIEFAIVYNDLFQEKIKILFNENYLRQIVDFILDVGILIKEIRGETEYLYLYKALTSKVVFENYNHDLAKLLSNGSLLLLKGTTFTCISLSSQQVLWETNIAEYSFKEITSINKLLIGVNYLYIYANDKNWNSYGFRVVDINSGECVFATNAFGPNIFDHESKIYSVGRASQIVQVMNKGSFEIERIDLSDELGEYVFETQCTPYFHKNELYVALVKKGEDIYSSWGIIDLETNKLKFKTEMLRDFNKKPTKTNKDFVSQIKANDIMVGVKVPGNMLHIYEKQ
jgi:hypothetical protein